MENSDKALSTGAKRVYEVTPSEMFANEVLLSMRFAKTTLKN
jgi:hypothetical protein